MRGAAAKQHLPALADVLQGPAACGCGCSSDKFFPEVIMFLRSAVLVLAVSLTCIGTHAQSSTEHEAELKKDMAELQSYTLTMDIVNRTVVTMSAIGDAVKSDPALEKASKDTADKAEGQATLSQMSSIISSSPKLTAIVAAHGFTPRKFALSEMSLIQTAIAVAAIQAGATVADMVSKGGANADNIKLFTEHKTELDELFKKYPQASE
jgi:hypothetical protein